MKNTNPQAEISSNRICQAVGHEWASTTVAENYRRCIREQCRTVERLVNEQWVEVRAHRHSHNPSPSPQPALFTPECLFPSKEEERRAERAYHLLLGR
jgi:hypothetical protein